MRLRLVNPFIFIVMLSVFFIKSPDAWADEVSPIAVKIQMNKDVFTLPEPIEGKVILTNVSPVNVHAVFDVHIFLNGSPQQSFSMAMKSVWPGVTRYSLQDFSIHLPVQAGHWRRVIKQQNLSEDQAATADFVVRPVS